MKTPSKYDRMKRLRVHRISLAIILLCTCLLFFFSFISHIEERGNVRLSNEATNLVDRNGGGGEIFYVAVTGVLFLCVIMLLLYLLISVSSDMRWHNLRADFVSGVSHEFKTPLSLIRLYSETLADSGHDFTPEERQKYIRIIARESERMSRIIENSLSFSRMEKGEIQHDLLEGDITETVKQTVLDYSQHLARQGFDVQLSIQPRLPLVSFNQDQVAQMLLNLLDNAAKYSGESREIRVDVRATDAEVTIQIQDHGIGIAADEKESIFKPFFRSSRTGGKGGCGLGLYLVDQMIKGHGGRIKVESEINNGSRFFLIFPVCNVDQSKVVAGKRSREIASVEEY